MKIKEKINLDLNGLIEHGPITIVAFGDSVTHGAVGAGEINYETVYHNRLKKKINELRALGVKVAICEVGDEFCPVFRLSEIKFDYAFMDVYSTSSLDGEDAERIAGSLVKYLHYLDAKVIAPGLDSEAKIAGAKGVGADGYTEDTDEPLYAEGGVSDE